MPLLWSSCHAHYLHLAIILVFTLEISSYHAYNATVRAEEGWITTISWFFIGWAGMSHLEIVGKKPQGDKDSIFTCSFSRLMTVIFISISMTPRAYLQNVFCCCDLHNVGFSFVPVVFAFPTQ